MSLRHFDIGAIRLYLSKKKNILIQYNTSFTRHPSQQHLLRYRWRRRTRMPRTHQNTHTLSHSTNACNKPSQLYHNQTPICGCICQAVPRHQSQTCWKPYRRRSLLRFQIRRWRRCGRRRGLSCQQCVQLSFHLRILLLKRLVQRHALAELLALTSSFGLLELKPPVLDARLLLERESEFERLVSLAERRMHAAPVEGMQTLTNL